jgi:hypothetical protein
MKRSGMSGISEQIPAAILPPGVQQVGEPPSLWVPMLLAALLVLGKYLVRWIGQGIDWWLDEIEQRRMLREAWRTARPCPRCRTMPDAMFLDCSRPGDCVYAEEEPPPEDESYLPPALVSSHASHGRA